MSQVAAYITAQAMSAVDTLTGNTGSAVSGDINANINVVGSGNVTVTGNPGTHTLTITTTGISTFNYTPVNVTPYTVLAIDAVLGIDTSALAITIKLPNAASQSGQTYYIKDAFGDAGTHNITVTTVGGAVLIDSATSIILNTNFESITVLWNGTEYLIL